jgi:hypothetical protein
MMVVVSELKKVRKDGTKKEGKIMNEREKEWKEEVSWEQKKNESAKKIRKEREKGKK